MDLLETLPPMLPVDIQAREVFTLLNTARNKGEESVFYRPCNNIPLDPKIITLLTAKGYTVVDQTKYDLKWTLEGPVRGASHLLYWIGIICPCTCSNL